MMPHDSPPWPAVYQRMQRWSKAGCFEALVHDLRAVLRLREGGAAEPTAVILDSRTLEPTPERGARAGYDGGKKRKGSKAHIAVDTLGHLLAVVVTPANEQDRSQVAALAEQAQHLTGQKVESTFVDQGYTGDKAAQVAAEHGITLEVIKLPDAKKGFVLLPRRWVVERSFGWVARFRRLARDDERLSQTLASYHFFASVCILPPSERGFLRLSAGALSPMSRFTPRRHRAFLGQSGRCCYCAQPMGEDDPPRLASPTASAEPKHTGSDVPRNIYSPGTATRRISRPPVTTAASKAIEERNC